MRGDPTTPMNGQRRGSGSKITRRRFLRLAGMGAGAIALGACGNTGRSSSSQGQGVRVARYDLEVGPFDFELGGQKVSSWGYNGGIPGPEIRLKQGETFRAAVRNRLPEGTTIHWHGVPVPNGMDGVPDVTQPPIGPGEDFTYEYKVPVSGTYFYHSHVGMQLDRAVYGPLVIEPQSESLSYDREFTLMLDDWLDGVDGTPEQKLKSLQSGGSEMSGMDGMDMGGGMGGMKGMGGTGEAPRQWAPDVVYPFYLVNGRPAEDPEELRVKRGERVRIRFINPSSATIYRVALEGHRMSVTHADGQPVEPVEVDALRIGQGERYDVLVDATDPGVWQLAAQAEGTKKLGRALFRYGGSSAPAPPADYLPPELEKELLRYDMLTATPEAEAPPGGEPDEVVAVTLDGDEKRYVWTINGEVFSEADPISLGQGKHVRFEMENKSMMPHPMHLHGHFFRVQNGTESGPMKDTVLVDP
ncbi:MAG: multicopper oxidase family protein, partial [Rubrobacteraceae bacterium]|nr:multicopper oxidase family protein [Rubrobacteraceae bacterium]